MYYIENLHRKLTQKTYIENCITTSKFYVISCNQKWVLGHLSIYICVHSSIISFCLNIFGNNSETCSTTQVKKQFKRIYRVSQIQKTRTKMNVEVILYQINYFRIPNVSIHINFYQNRFINECVKKNFLKFTGRYMTICDLQ